MHELEAGVQLALAVFPEPAVLLQAGEGAFDAPSFWQHGEGVEFVALDDLDCGTEALLDAIGEGLASIATVGEHAFHASQSWFRAFQGLQRTAAVSHLSGGDGNGMGQALRVHRDVALDAGDLLARIVSLLSGAVGVLHALRVNDQKASRDVAPLSLSGLANRFFLRPAPGRWLRPNRVGSTWRSTNAPFATLEILPEACATGNRS